MNNQLAAKRIVTFDHRPDSMELGTNLGYGLMGSSSQAIRREPSLFAVGPQHIPPLWVAAVSYLVIAVLVALLLFSEGDSSDSGWTKFGWVLAIGGSVVIAPCMIGGAALLNHYAGNTPYLIFEAKSKTVKLPRHDLKLHIDQLREIVFLDRFASEGRFDSPQRFWQVSLLVEECRNRWTYIHLYNDAGASSGLRWLSLKDEHQKIAESLGIAYRRLKFSRQESEDLLA